jgi:D-ribose pyranose/furanose isomerase RbsD
VCKEEKSDIKPQKYYCIYYLYIQKKSEIKTQIHNHEALKQKIEACKCKNKLKSGKSYNQIEVLA